MFQTPEQRLPCSQGEDHGEIGCPPAAHGGPQWSKYPPAALGGPHGIAGRCALKEVAACGEEHTLEQAPSKTCGPWGTTHAVAIYS